MKMVNFKDYIICPECHNNLDYYEKEFFCNNCNNTILEIRGRLILVQKNNPLFPLKDYINNKNNKINVKKKSIFKNFIPSSSTNLSQSRILKKINKTLDTLNNDCNILVLGCDSQRSKLIKRIGSRASIIFSDISLNADCDIIFDIHNIPFKSKTFDLVITTAVLEHIYNPEVAVKNIYRVLKDDGIVYSEIPFMQQVHEGAYDFTRFSLVGHHKLFDNFEHIEDGLVAGPATAFYWSLEHLLIAFSSNNKIRNFIKLISRLFFSWIKYLDYIISFNRKSLDGASCTYILAKKSINKRSPIDIIKRYD